MNEFRLRVLIAICMTMAIAGNLTGCAKSGKAERDSETGSADSADSATGVDSGTITGTETHSDVDTVTATESATDTDDTATSVDTGSDIETVHQAPVDIRIINMTSKAVYLDGFQPVMAKWNEAGQWTEVRPGAPFCMMGCSDWEDFGYCCIDCDYDVALVAILPGETYTYTWKGRFYKTETETCECACYYSEDPVRGEYRFAVDVFPEVSCGGSTCAPPAETGIIYSYVIEGESQRFTATMSIPYTGDALEIRIVPDDDTDTATDSGDTGSEMDTATDTGTGDTESETVSDTGGVHQEPIEVQVTNRSDSVAYLNGISPMKGEREVDGEWIATSLNQPPCSFACEDVSTDPESCCIQCEMATMAYALLPGEAATFTWEGLIYQMETTTCECGCYYSELPSAGEYRFTVAARANTECYQNPCAAPAESGMRYDRLPIGTSREFSVNATVPYAGSPLQIEIFRDDRCDDGTVPLCDMIPPTCAPESEILAYRNDCYQCVDAETCAP